MFAAELILVREVHQRHLRVLLDGIGTLLGFSLNELRVLLRMLDRIADCLQVVVDVSRVVPDALGVDVDVELIMTPASNEGHDSRSMRLALPYSPVDGAEIQQPNYI